MPQYTFGPWRPDLTDVAQLDDAGILRLREATNVVPGINCYYPQPDAVAVMNSLTATCQGAFACTDRDGNVNWFAGTATELKRLASNTATWTTVGAGYALAAENRWEFTRYGNQVFATAVTNDLQFMTMSAGSSFAAVGGAPPRFRHIAVVKNFLVGAGTDNDPQRVQWSALDNPQSWTVAATTMADFQDLLGPGGWNQGIIVGLAGADAVIVQERAVWRMMYVGIPLIFQIDSVESARGAIASGSIVQSAGYAFYLSEDGFYRFDGTTSEPIGNGKIDAFFSANVDNSRYDAITAVADVDRALVMWSFVSGASTIPDHIIVHNWSTGEWSLIDQECEILWRSLRRHSSPDGIPDLSIFDTGHRAATFTSANKAATILTDEYQFNPGGRALITELYPIIETGAPTTNILHRSNIARSLSTEPTTTLNAQGFAPLRVNDRYHQIKQRTASGESWSKWQGFKLRFGPVGRR